MGIRILGKTQFDDRGHTDENSLYKYRLKNKVKLTNKIIYTQGINSNKFPLLTLTDGLGHGKSKAAAKLNATSYTWPTMGKMRHITEMLNIVGTTTEVGKGFVTFDVVFKDKRAIPAYGLYTPDKKHMVRVQAEHGEYAGGYRYTLQLQGGNYDASIAADNFTSGKYWVLSAPTTPESKGLGNRSHHMAPGEMTNQYGFYRWSKEISGNIANEVVEVEFDLEGGGTTNKWMPWEMYLFDLDRMLYLNEDLFDQEYNRLEDGSYTMYDPDSDEPIVRGAGIKQIIKESGIYDTYSKVLPLAKFEAISSELSLQNNDGMSPELIIITGKGGAKAFHTMMENDAVGKGYTVAMGEAAITQNAGGLEYGSYFIQYKSFEGYKYTVKIDSSFDEGLKAEMDKANGNFMPGTSYTMTSFDMYILDGSTYNGERNIQTVAMKGQELITGVYKGLTEVPPSTNLATSGNLISDTRDASRYELKLSKGINMLKGDSSVFLEAVE
ncbi:hypothetical protein KAU11_11360 [Candidatus Babeliales bacterium]|nr:hypothetical protein [Candidatus Babeliales bacterium]